MIGVEAGAVDILPGIPAKVASADGARIACTQIVEKTLSGKFAWSTTRFLDTSSILLICI